MSAPNQQTPSHSPTPSKSSLRRTSGLHNNSQRSLLPPPSPHFEDNATTEVRYSPRSPPNQTLEYESSEDEDDDEDDEELVDQQGPTQSNFEHHEGSYFPAATAQELTHPFEPLFTLIEDSLTSEHHHPAIHYVFADDDNEIVTEAALRSLEEDDLESSSETAQAKEIASHVSTGGQLPPLQAGVREHYLILDISPSTGIQTSQAIPQSQIRTPSQVQSQVGGDSIQQPNTQSQSNVQTAPFTVSAFTSLSPHWQIHAATISSAPTMSEAPDGEDESLMLRIEGRGFSAVEDLEIPIARHTKAKAQPSTTAADVGESSHGQDQDTETLMEMIERFQTNLREIQKLMESDTIDIAASQGIETTDIQDAVGDTDIHDLDAQD